MSLLSADGLGVETEREVSGEINVLAAPVTVDAAVERAELPAGGAGRGVVFVGEVFVGEVLM